MNDQDKAMLALIERLDTVIKKLDELAEALNNTNVEQKEQFEKLSVSIDVVKQSTRLLEMELI